MTRQEVLTTKAGKSIEVSRDVASGSRRGFVVPPSQAATFSYRE